MRVVEKKCVYCGKYKKATVDHFYPKAIYRWCGDEYKEAIIDKKNTVYACRACNFRKQEKIYPIETVQDEEKKKELVEVRKNIGDGVSKFFGLKKKLRKKQNGRCYGCGKMMTKNEGIIRRIDPEKPRKLENACLVCDKCNKKETNFR